MARLKSPTGVTVNVGDEKAEQLRSIGYKPVSDEPAKKAPAKRSASSKSES